MFDAERSAIGTVLIRVGEATEDVAEVFQEAYDPHERNGLGKVPEVAGKLMRQLGNKILPNTVNES